MHGNQHITSGTQSMQQALADLEVCLAQLKVEAGDALVAERRQALEAEKAAKTQELKQRAEVARQRVLEQVTFRAFHYLRRSSDE